MINAAKWQRDFERLLNRAEAESVKDFRRYYNEESEKAIEIYRNKNTITTPDLLGVFTIDGFSKRYEELYEKIGIIFANWYAKENQKYIKKDLDIQANQEPWRAYFRSYGIQVAAQKVTLVQGTAKENLIRVMKKLMADPIFQTEGEIVKSRMLRRTYNHYSNFQARRLVRTEATNAANAATYQSAQDVFAGADMQKEWITSLDGREREWHREASGQIVDFNEDFSVGGELIQRPGIGSGRNVINCRCSMAPFPKPEADTIGTFENVGFGLA
jgi:hypothetical protein